MSIKLKDDSVATPILFVAFGVIYFSQRNNINQLKENALEVAVKK